MRILKFTALVVVLLGVGFFGYIHYYEPLLWPGQIKRESIRLLSAAKTSVELQKAVTSLGALIVPTNGGWIAIRYRDTHAFQIQSLSIAHDSDGRWFECERHFCGMFRNASQNLASEIRIRAEMPEFFTNQAASVSTHNAPAMNELISLLTATNLDDARKELLAIGFKEFTP